MSSNQWHQQPQPNYPHNRHSRNYPPLHNPSMAAGVMSVDPVQDARRLLSSYPLASATPSTHGTHCIVILWRIYSHSDSLEASEQPLLDSHTAILLRAADHVQYTICTHTAGLLSLQRICVGDITLIFAVCTLRRRGSLGAVKE